MGIRPLKWILFLPALALSLLGYGLAGNLKYGIGSWEVPAWQPTQMWSKIDYDPKLTNPFFKSDRWSYPWWIIKHPEGTFEDTTSDKRPEREPPRLKHTAECFVTALRYGRDKDLLSFCEARLLDTNVTDLLIHEKNPDNIDALRVQIRKGMFACQYWTFYKWERGHLIWTTKRQRLTLNRKTYGKGDMIKGRIDFECVEEEVTDLKGVEKSDRNPATIKVYGVFKTIVE